MKIASPDQIMDFTPPSAATMRRSFALARAYFRPQFFGLETLDLRRPALWVGNHTLYGLTDAPLMIEHLYTQHDTLLRGLGDRGHFNVPFWGSLLTRNGMVLGSPEHCAALMQARQHVLVFPGGGREVMRRKGEACSLVWKKRTGFARLAIEHGYDIIPFASVGPDDNFKILIDANDVTATRAWQFLAGKLPLMEMTRGGDMIPPIARGIGPTLIPRPQTYYFGFGKRIRSLPYKKHADPVEAAWALREKVAASIEDQFVRLKVCRATDRAEHWSRLRKWLAPI